MRAIKKLGYESKYIAYHYSETDVFNGNYDDLDMVYWSKSKSKADFPFYLSKIRYIWLRRIWLRDKIKEIEPDLILTSGTWFQVYELYLATFGMKLSYKVHIFGSLFAFPPSSEKTKYALIFKKVFNELRNSKVSYQEVVPTEIPKMTLKERINIEIKGLVKYLAMQKAEDLLVLSESNRYETNKLYNKDPKVLRAAFSKDIFDYSPKSSLTEEYDLEDKHVFLSLCRLAQNKRIDLAILGLAELIKETKDVIFIIGGTGPEEEKLKLLVKEMDLDQFVKFIGFVDESSLLDYMSTADTFVSLDLADFDIAPLEALAMGTRVIWSEEMDLKYLEDELPDWIISTKPDRNSVKRAMQKSFENIEINKSEYLKIRSSLDHLTWETYAEKLVNPR